MAIKTMKFLFNLFKPIKNIKNIFTLIYKERNKHFVGYFHLKTLYER